jgi:hypothetical protein
MKGEAFQFRCAPSLRLGGSAWMLLLLLLYRPGSFSNTDNRDCRRTGSRPTRTRSRCQAARLAGRMAPFGPATRTASERTAAFKLVQVPRRPSAHAKPAREPWHRLNASEPRDSAWHLRHGQCLSTPSQAHGPGPGDTLPASEHWRAGPGRFKVENSAVTVRDNGVRVVVVATAP